MDKYQTLREKDHPENNVYPNIQPQNIPAGAITSSKIAPGAVIGSTIGAGAIQSQHISLGAVGASAIGENAVNSDNIASGAVITEKISDGAVTGIKIADNTIGANKLMNGSVTESKIYRDLISLTDYLIAVSANTFALACEALVKLANTHIALGIYYSEDDMQTMAHDAKITVETGWIYIVQLKSGGYGEVASITNDAQFSAFMSSSGASHLIFLKVVR